MKAEDLVSYRAISLVLTGKEMKVRRDTATKYDKDVQELLDYVQVWITRHDGKYINTKRKK